ncbi:methyl-CpG-binding domain-containing protein [Dionaea muscipula]
MKAEVAPLKQSYSDVHTYNRGYDGTAEEAGTNQHVGIENLWKSNDERVMPGSLDDSSSSQTQASGSFHAFGTLMDKGENGLLSVNEKFDGLSSIEAEYGAKADTTSDP